MQLTSPIQPGRLITKPLGNVRLPTILLAGQLATNKGFGASRISQENELVPSEDSKIREQTLVRTKNYIPETPRFEFGLSPSSSFSIASPYVSLQGCPPYTWLPYPCSAIPQVPYEMSYLNQLRETGMRSKFGLIPVTAQAAQSQINNSPIIASHCSWKLQEPIAENSLRRYNILVKRSKSLPNTHKSKAEVADPFLSANYKYRNVFKAVIRRMHTCIRKNKSGLVQILQTANFTFGEIERAFTRIAYYKNAERKSGKKRMSVRMIKEATQERSIYTFILKDALTSMLQDWNEGKLGRLTERNVTTYKKVCGSYLNQIAELLSN